MTVHLCRDFQTNSNSSLVSPGYNDMSGYVAMYIMASFMRYVLGYSVVGQTNFNLNGSTYTIAQSNSTFATVNPDGSVTIPSGVYTVNSGSDPGRMLVLKSPGHPTVNSGCFLITGINSNISYPNSYVVSARIGGSGLLTPESGLSWAVMENDAIITGNNVGYGWATIWGYGSSQFGANVPNPATATSYAGDGSATTPRIILQSPHSTAWQVRLCLEPSGQVVYTSINDPVSVAPGFNGNSAGDFPRHSPSLNGGLFFNNNPNDPSGILAGTTIGHGARAGFIGGCRISIVGDDTGQAVCCFTRLSTGNGVGTGYVVFGIPDNETSPLPPTNMQRLFVLGEPTASYNGYNGIVCSFLWNGGGNGVVGKLGVGFGLDQSICSCSPSCWTQVYQVAQGASPMFSPNAGDSPFLSGTELLPVDLVNGAFYSNAPSGVIGGARILNQQTRTIGTIPFMRAGRANFSLFSTTTDPNNAWYHFQNGVYMQYGGPAVVP